MSVKYIDLRKQRHNAQMKDLQIGKQVNSTISRKMHNFENNIDDLDLEEKDDRSNYERNEDLNQIRQQIGAKLNKLFANDADEVNTFMEFINHNNISIQDFNTVYPELLKNSDPNTNTASYSIPKFNQLLDNDYGNTKQTALMKRMYDLVEKVYKSGKLNMTEKMADDIVDRLEYYNQSPSSDIDEKAKDIMSSGSSKEDMVVDLANLFETPLKQTTLDGWTEVESKSSKRRKKREQREQEEEEVFSPKKSGNIEFKPPFSSKKLNKSKKEELQKLAQDYGLPIDGFKKDLVARLMELNA
jgi:hypothetical protein